MTIRPTTLRKMHTYIGVFIAPTILFFATSGGLQLVGLHEAHGNYRPPVFVQKLARTHMEQIYGIKPDDRGHPKQDALMHEDSQSSDGPNLPVVLLKLFFLLVACGLIATTGLGLWFAWRARSGPRALLGTFLIGVLIPIFLLAV